MAILRADFGAVREGGTRICALLVVLEIGLCRWRASKCQGTVYILGQLTLLGRGGCDCLRWIRNPRHDFLLPFHDDVSEAYKPCHLK